MLFRSNKIRAICGKILFLIPDRVDQVMDYGNGENLTRDLHSIRSDQSLIRLQTQSHWSAWTFTTYNEVFNFLASLGVVHADYKLVGEEQLPESKPLTCFKGKCVPILKKACI